MNNKRKMKKKKDVRQIGTTFLWTGGERDMAKWT
jgi:hypothetical protein